MIHPPEVKDTIIFKVYIRDQKNFGHESIYFSDLGDILTYFKLRYPMSDNLSLYTDIVKQGGSIYIRSYQLKGLPKGIEADAWPARLITKVR